MEKDAYVGGGPDGRVVVGPVDADQADGACGATAESLQRHALRERRRERRRGLTSGDAAASRQPDVPEVPPGHGLHGRVEAQRLLDAHGGEGEAGQVLPDHDSQ